MLLMNMSYAQGYYYTYPSINRTVDSSGNKTALKNVNRLKSNSTPTLPYPIIFIHGLTGTDTTWKNLTDYLDVNFGLINGGRIDYCLNYDGDNTIANKNFWPTTNADIALFTPDIIKGDFYCVNFDVGFDGSVPPIDHYDVWSNQQAIVKQGLVLSDAIARVINLTGKDKVILVGHSMGGLAAREYLQNTDNWVAESHHVAKLVTVGTPHGGSNLTGFGIVGSFIGISEKMDAVRDLRISYTASSENGAYLYGGHEDYDYIKNNILFDYYNVDVNCNGVIGDDIEGLNYKKFPIDLDISCIVGECSKCNLSTSYGDGIVNESSADLSNFYNIPKLKLFYSYSDNSLESHTDLPKMIVDNIKGLDEPDDYELAYDIDFNTYYTGLITESTYFLSDDIDMYRFKLGSKKRVTVSMSNMNASDVNIDILDNSGNKISDTRSSNGSKSMTSTMDLSAGTYYLDVHGYHDDYAQTYGFKLSQATIPTTPATASEMVDNDGPCTYTIADVTGRVVSSGSANGGVDISILGLSPGVYVVNECGSARVVHVQ
jgi:pimeloyl-ACP methyl ester carboxylesterase